MTASVSTRGMKGACFTDEERERMYLETVNFYIDTLLKNPGQKIVFAENSGWDLQQFCSKLKPHDTERLEMVAIDPSHSDISRGKGYNELLLMTEAVGKSRHIQEAGSFFKVTGRYPVYNIQYLLDKAGREMQRRQLDIYCDIKDHKVYDWLHNGWNGHSFDCRMFAVTNSYFLTKLSPLYTRCDDSKEHCLLEDVLFAAVKSDPQIRIKDRFPREAVLGGVAGHTLSAISFSQAHNSPKAKAKRFVGNFIRIFMPWFKF